MAKRPKIPGNPVPGPGGGGGGGNAWKFALGAAGLIILIVLIVVAAGNGPSTKGNNVAYQNATITGSALAQMPSNAPIPAAGQDPAVGETIPTVDGKTFDGSTVTIKPGKAQLIAFIAHWCPHCQKEVPLIVGWQADGSISNKVKITAVSTMADSTRDNFPPAAWLTRVGWKNQAMVDTPRADVLQAFGATGFPTLIAVTADGKVAQRASGELSIDQVQALVNAALGKATSISTTPGANPSPVPTSAP